VGQPVRLCVCDDAGAICVPVHFQVEMVNNTVYIDSEQVNELVAAIHLADDEVQAREDQDGD
jgi:hypothetical protein